MDDAAKKEQKKNRVLARRKKFRLEESMKRRQFDKKAKGRTIKLAEEAPVPGRNDPCPLHPEHKLKKCPHGCLDVFKRNRSRHAGDATIVRVEDGDKRKGKIGTEIDPAAGALTDLAQISGDGF